MNCTKKINNGVPCSVCAKTCDFRSRMLNCGAIMQEVVDRGGQHDELHSSRTEMGIVM
jgi:hypothetical protein